VKDSSLDLLEATIAGTIWTGLGNGLLQIIFLVRWRCDVRVGGGKLKCPVRATVQLFYRYVCKFIFKRVDLVSSLYPYSKVCSLHADIWPFTQFSSPPSAMMA
jgi:hypothetical protein